MFTIEVDLSAVDNADQLPKGLDQVLGWNGMLIGMDEVTEQNKYEWATRLRFYEWLGVTVIVEGTGANQKRRNLNIEELGRLVGAKVPPAEPKTRKQFMKQAMVSLERELDTMVSTLKSETAVTTEAAKNILQFAVITTETPAELPPVEMPKESNVA